MDWIALTKSERRVMLFLVITLILGYGIRLTQKASATPHSFDYKAQDSLFATLSYEHESEHTEEDENFIQGKLNINKATKEQLIKLPGIGETIAERILEYRKERGNFTKIEQLSEIKGIGKNKLEKIKGLVAIE